MSPNVTFQEDTEFSSHSSQTRKSPYFVRLVMSLSGGFIKTEKQAGYVLIGFVVIALLISAFLLLDGDEETENSAEKYRDVRQYVPL